jgi:hypothetical protein
LRKSNANKGNQQSYNDLHVIVLRKSATNVAFALRMIGRLKNSTKWWSTLTSFAAFLGLVFKFDTLHNCHTKKMMKAVVALVVLVGIVAAQQPPRPCMVPNTFQANVDSVFIDETGCNTYAYRGDYFYDFSVRVCNKSPIITFLDLYHFVHLTLIDNVPFFSNSVWINPAQFRALNGE